MDNQKAIRLIRNLPTMCEFTDAYGEPMLPLDSDAYYEAVDIAVSALEKQIPKKPMIKIDVFNENLWNLYCPTCGTWVGMHNKRLKQTDMHNNTNSEICAKCGQMFDLELGGNR